jgi:hypothetical protein
MAKKSGYTFIHDSPIERTTVRPSSSMPTPMPPSRPPGSMQKSEDIYAPAVPVTSNDEASSDITSNPYRPDDVGLFGGASSPPSASDIVHPTSDELRPGPGVGVPRPDIH